MKSEEYSTMACSTKCLDELDCTYCWLTVEHSPAECWWHMAGKWRIMVYLIKLQYQSCQVVTVQHSLQQFQLLHKFSLSFSKVIMYFRITWCLFTQSWLRCKPFSSQSMFWDNHSSLTLNLVASTDCKTAHTRICTCNFCQTLSYCS